MLFENVPHTLEDISIDEIDYSTETGNYRSNDRNGQRYKKKMH